MSRYEKHFSLRLSPELTSRVDECAGRLRAVGLTVSRSDVARLLIARALDVIGSDPRVLLATEPISPERERES